MGFWGGKGWGFWGVGGGEYGSMKELSFSGRLISTWAT